MSEEKGSETIRVVTFTGTDKNWQLEQVRSGKMPLLLTSNSLQSQTKRKKIGPMRTRKS